MKYLMSAARWPLHFALPKWQLHRGYHLNGEIENTRAALRSATQHGAKMCEVDLRLTKDHVPVLFHDQDLKRTANLDFKIENLNLQELRGYAPIDTLQEVLGDPHICNYLNLEIKSNQIWNDSIERRVRDVLIKTNSCQRVLFSSFNPISLWKLQSLLPEIPRALLVSDDLDQKWLREMWLAPLLSFHLLHFEKKMLLSQVDLHDWQKRGFRVAAWTVNDQPQAKMFLRWGFDSIISDQLMDAESVVGTSSI